MKLFPRLYEENGILDTLMQTLICLVQKEKFRTNFEKVPKNASPEFAPTCKFKYLALLHGKRTAGTAATANSHLPLKHGFCLSGCFSKMSFFMISYYPQGLLSHPDKKARLHSLRIKNNTSSHSLTRKLKTTPSPLVLICTVWYCGSNWPKPSWHN